MRFLRNLLAVITGLFIFSFILFIILMGIISVASSEKLVTIEDNSVLQIILSGNLEEREVDDPFSELTFPGMGPFEMGLKEIKQAIRHAASDDQIKGIFLEPRFFSAGFASLEEIRTELEKFKESGKFIVAYSEYYVEQGYFLASVADEIYLTPDYGNVELNGLNVEVAFFKGTLDKLEIEPQIFRVGEYKGAVEPFTRKDFSKENEEQISSFVNSTYDHVLRKIADSRGLSFEEIVNISDSMLVRDGSDAEKYNLITKMAYLNEVREILNEKISAEDESEVNMVSYRKYNKSFKESEYARDRIAVIVGTGVITMGKGDDRSIGSEKYTELIREARENKRVKGIVLRINSGGGSALASDVIWNEIRQTAEEKPVIASLSDVAASGGYYLAMGCDSIVASPTSITGSIGIFGMIFNMQGLFENKLGLTFDNINTGNFSGLYTVTRPLTDYEKQIVQNDVERGYRTFTTKAAEGRNMELEKMLELAGGRVWSGIEARDIGLIDVFGTLEDAISMAADKADVDEYRVVYYPAQKTILEQIMSDLSNDVQAKWLRLKTGDLYPYLEIVRDLDSYIGLQARMPYTFKLN
ncbi:MAG: signal peptide peptidase SppA [Cyclobacteriaceae bacterium]|nr:signal peptide peptidase SppA [Cyclobacteriaceae bacterium]